MVLYDKKHKEKVDTLINILMTRVDLREVEPSWFLGIRIIRDRQKKLLWLCQDSYIDKLAETYNIKPLAASKVRTPLAVDPLTPYEGKAAQDEILAYQKRIGSIMFAATGTRPDIAKAASCLSQFLTNPGPEHLSAANRAISY